MKLTDPSCIWRWSRARRIWNKPILLSITVSILIIIGTFMSIQWPLSYIQIKSSLDVRNSDRFPKPSHYMYKEYMSRLTRAQDVCLNSKPKKVRRIMVDKTKIVANCVIPKAGCSFWINIFRFIKNETHGKIYASPFHIPRWITHYGKRSYEYAILDIAKIPAFLENAFRFMFVRDPYKRLWASWIDKFLLPDFWFGPGNIIAKQRGFGERARRCATNITFVDFLLFITNDSFKHPQKHNEHWMPFHELCDPCIFRPHFIGKMETFEEDSDNVLAQTNWSWVKQLPLPTTFLPRGVHVNENKHISDSAQFARVNTTKKHSNLYSMMQLKASDKHILHEMEIITDYVFPRRRYDFSPEIEKCVSRHFIAQRLWRAFQYNGYIPMDCALNLSKEVNSETLKESLLDAYLQWSDDYTDRHQCQKEQKRKSMSAAYQLVPLPVMKKIRNIYMTDFLQFGYDPEPKDLFHRE